MRSIDVAPLPIPELESHLDEVAGHRLKSGIKAARTCSRGAPCGR